jgi:hypothetical protein
MERVSSLFLATGLLFHLEDGLAAEEFRSERSHDVPPTFCDEPTPDGRHSRQEVWRS